ncbi:alpha/beta hydrolase [Arthrobacter sp. BL-252-APC-1A]|uniref:alpha/beta fold hydrolase n=1 Tax=Arthrobacter sp. BL-252-APC-1A TaxID=2606622 RepID=UPI0012B3868E|nr:alpha/beta hydrolase [Arthrobacter sp. BL-252-APC-1A]MSR99259.1 alpha/beta hydrolase [Arthrobacter sp. BL-252-APC-1A]
MTNYTSIGIPVRGGTLHTGIWGPDDPAAPTVLAVHGVTASHRTWGMVAEALPQVRFIAPDLRGRGRSNSLPGPYGMPVHADDLAAVLTALDATRAVVAGHSMGAFAALVLAHRHPELVESLVLVDGGLPLDVPAGLSDEQIIQAVLGPAARRLEQVFPSLREYEQFWAPHPAFTGHWNGLLHDYLAYDLQPHDGGGFRASTCTAALVEDTAELHRGTALLQSLEGLRHRVQLLRAPRGLLNEEPGLYAPAYISAWKEKLPSLEVSDVPATNHYTIVMDNPGAASVAAVLAGEAAALRMPAEEAPGG